MRQRILSYNYTSTYRPPFVRVRPPFLQCSIKLMQYGAGFALCFPDSSSFCSRSGDSVSVQNLTRKRYESTVELQGEF